MKKKGKFIKNEVQLCIKSHSDDIKQLNHVAGHFWWNQGLVADEFSMRDRQISNFLLNEQEVLPLTSWTLKQQNLHTRSCKIQYGQKG